MKYANDLLHENEILFLCEHWLRPNEVSHMKNNDFKSLWTNLKSSIDPTEILIGRPYGGCGFVCNNIPGVSYRPIQCASDRLCGVEVTLNDGPTLSLFGVYLPHDDHCLLTHELYLECLSELQGLIENCESGPCMVKGDFNTRLPQSNVLPRRWYNRRGFTPRSAVLYDFCCDNDLCVMNFVFSQPVNYTFHRHNARSYIDHVLLSQCMSSSVLDCKIAVECSDNTSDHLPIRCTLKLPKPSPSPQVLLPSSHRPFHFPRPRWEIPQVLECYQESLNAKLSSVSAIDAQRIYTSAQAAAAVNEAYGHLCSAMHDAAQDAVDATARAPRTSFQKSWWTADCSAARDRCRLFFRIWKEMGRPLHGASYECYRDARRTYRRICRSASNLSIQKNYHLLNNLYSTKCPGKFWNMVRKSRAQKMTSDGIGMPSLVEHFSRKFAAAPLQNYYLQDCDSEVQAKFDALSGIPLEVMISEFHVRRLIRRLRLGCAPGADGIMAEHLRSAINTALPFHLCALMTACFRFGCIPDAFNTGLLVPILKKPNLDAKKPANYRPITISSITSKVLELYIIEKTDKDFDPAQFGFVSHRGTTTAISLAHDVGMYCLSRNTPVYMCSLDAEGAFDAIPFPVLFKKAAASMSDCCWRLLYTWYGNMHISIKWNGQVSSRIPVLKGTRQGGLTSPMLFNLFYKDLISLLNHESCGITIRENHYNAFCYADDVLLASTTPTGLQKLIDKAVDYITTHGLRFNPSKTSCYTFGKTSYISAPKWTIEGQELEQVDHLVYLGAALKNDGGAAHVNSRSQAALKAFYGLQGAGLCYRGVTPEVSAHLYSVGVRTVLSYGCEAMKMNKTSMKKVESTQGKLVKSFLGLRKTSRTTPLIQALDIPSLETSIGLASLNLLRSSVLHPSMATPFYSHLLTSTSSLSLSSDTLVKRCREFCDKHALSIHRYVFNDCYRKEIMSNLKCVDLNGLVDSIKILIHDYSDTARNIVQLLVNPF